ncbi:MAG: GHKL domain-containing protein [Bacteroidetes bacterium]|nr:GHKL domain-containing protein [Bacteroidota bacterium]
MHSNEGYSAFQKSLSENYFTGYWEKYDLKYIVYDSLCNVIVKSNNSVNDKLDHYEEVVKKTGTPTASKSLFYIPVNQDENAGLLAKLKFIVPQNNFSNPATLYVELLPKFITEEIGYPQLLLDKAIVPRHDEEAYSFAKYKEHSFVPLQRVGKYKYPLNSSIFDSLLNRASFIDLNGYNHYLYRFNNRDSDLIVVSKEPVQLLNRLTIFSYFFTIFSGMMLLYFALFRWNMRIADFGNKFKNRIQVVLVGVVLSAILLIGGGTIIFLKREYKAKNLSSISEKIHSVNAELAHEIGDEKSLSFTSNQYLNYVLSKQSNVFYSDINFYDLSGNLIASSRPQIFEQGLVSQKIDPVAFYQLKVNRQFEFTHNEKIGELDFLSCYMPFISNNNELLGYLNLPYFNKQNELENEISSVLVALINVYVLLFVLSIVLAVFISNRIMEPLKLLQNKISHIRLGKSNELIEWKNKDEIGELISEYNRMILELSNSAEMLAKSERESAWREMAKQVAHEIKNPLTPMKLSAQHLERSYKDGAPDWDKRLEKFTKTLIEQIDALSNIANEFSNFAKMPKANLEEINLSQIISSVVSLYQNSEEFAVEVEFNGCEKIKVFADKDQLIRLFNNLIKNAIQAIPDSRKGLIKIKFERLTSNIKVEVCDNGKGIEEHQKQSIFTPNFTTKNAGMGLGLAMAKSIVENCKGEISFTSEENVGTVFSIVFPIAD